MDDRDRDAISGYAIVLLVMMALCATSTVVYIHLKGEEVKTVCTQR